MCGITGWINWNEDAKQNENLLAAMTNTLVPRGPDNEGTWIGRHTAFGHRRLIVVDPAGGAQPMIREHGDNKFVMVYNGELYNTDDIRNELTVRGHRFISTSDTEVLLVSYIEWGAACLDRLNGIFAFAIWNEAAQELFMARDRLGVKPLFYSEQNGTLVFGSELKALLAHPSVSPVMKAEGLAEIFALGPARTPGVGVFHNVHELLPGHFLRYSRQGLQTRAYWSLESRPHEDTLEQTIEHIRDLFRDTVQRQLVADVPVCTLLSGGLDSSAISAFASEYFQEKGRGALHTFSVDYVDNDIFFKANEFQPNPDAPWVEKVSSYLGTVHHNIFFDTPNLIESLDTAVSGRDLPGMTDIDGSLYLFCKEIKKEVTVALSGECADEVFGGYPWFHRKEALESTTFPWARNVQDKIKFYSSELKELIKPEQYVTDRYQQALDEVPRLQGENAQDARIREMFYLNLTRWMPTLLDRKDRMSMATGLEVRVPFCDHRLVEYMWNVPWEFKTYGQREKGILRKALAGMLPDDVLERRKSPYPKTHNPSYLAAVQQRVLHILDDYASPLLPFIDVPAVRKFASADVSAIHMPWFGQLMNVPQFFAFLIQIDRWMREYHVSVQ
ncbi:asparagine synthase (glutamine-hydrolyzing) [Aneurinibacillus sp. Ricciae_BoGa-3]|uniref:asparagine synthase (glutamine-hydrolyzing) n=1 Tax=Aneurinibacillus sp. Ricciae_BoGa-3 TaxID=3022697 RepID=UPI002341AC89|nr:asparagine synthase (glutamine-hydrolyzing) [Aneurinibacillus sp. Ricciae_BoGa-3]WCK54400.1 asparagine synthase (glutamine-hydrolyzing) [Aneurinibacillus sp. Ricciae_BoGa-3]